MYLDEYEGTICDMGNTVTVTSLVILRYSPPLYGKTKVFFKFALLPIWWLILLSLQTIVSRHHVLMEGRVSMNLMNYIGVHVKTDLKEPFAKYV